MLLQVTLKDEYGPGTSDGLAVQDIDGRWFYYTSEHHPFMGLERAWILDVVVDSTDRVWAITKSHIFVFNGQEWQSFGQDIIGTTAWANAIEFDSAGQAWIATENKGIAVFQGQLDIGPFVKLVSPPLMKDMPDYDLKIRLSPEQNDRVGIFKTISKYLLLTLIVFAGSVQIVRVAR